MGVMTYPKIVKQLPSGHLVALSAKRVRWSPWWPLTRYEGSATVSGTDKNDGIRAIPVEFGMAGWTSCGAVMPYRSWSLARLYERMLNDVESSAWA